jgi:hypothetical protein
MAPGETNDLVAQNSKAGIPGAVLLESGSGPMCTPAVDFDNESLIAPEEVDLVSGNPSIDLGLGKGGTEVGERACGIGHGYPVATGAMTGHEGGGAVEGDAAPLSLPRGARDADVHWSDSGVPAGLG